MPKYDGGYVNVSNVSNAYKEIQVNFSVSFSIEPKVSIHIIGASANRFVGLSSGSITSKGFTASAYCTSGTADIQLGWIAVGT